MCRSLFPVWWWAFVSGWLTSVVTSGADPEFRALWVGAGAPGFRTPAEVARLMKETRAAGFNALFVQVRKNGEAGYASDLEPRMAGLAAGYDPLAEVLQQARDARLGRRLEVHAWMDLLQVGSARTPVPSDARHVRRQHADWLTVSSDGTNRPVAPFLDPGVPDVQDYLVGVAREVVSRYDVDGLYLDQLHYPVSGFGPESPAAGFHPRAVERFQQLKSFRRRPTTADPAWSQFCRDQITAIVRRIYLEAGLVRPMARVSVGCVGDNTGTYPLVWERSQAFGAAFQDWPQWLREGVVDTPVLRLYFESQINLRDWREWQKFLLAQAPSRPVLLALGAEFNRATDTLSLARSAREGAGGSGGLFGFGFHSYAVPAADRRPEEFFKALVEAALIETNRPPLFAEPAGVPAMSWKAQPRRAQLLGRALLDARPLEGALVELKGRGRRTLSTDASGWFGAADLLAGEYLIRVRPSGTDRVARVGLVTLTNGVTSQPELLDAAADLDGDGSNNGDELAAGTDPLNAGSRLGLEVTPLADRLSLRVRPVSSNRRYLIETAPEASGPWVPVTDSDSLDGTEAVALFKERPSYFRIRVTY